MKHKKDLVNTLMSCCMAFAILIYFERFSLLFLGEYPFPENPDK